MRIIKKERCKFEMSRQVVLIISILLSSIIFSACSSTSISTDYSSSYDVIDDAVTDDTDTETEEEVEVNYLTGDEYEAVNAMLQGSWSSTTGNVYTEFVFDNGNFEVYSEVSGVYGTNSGTYNLTDTDIELHYQNGAVKNARYYIIDGEFSFDMPQ